MVIPPFRKAVLFLALVILFSGCAVKKGCPATSSNIGAERILSGDPKAVKAIKRGKKFKV
jgi:hypothetical protein